MKTRHFFLFFFVATWQSAVFAGEPCAIVSAAGIAESLILLVTYGIRYQFRLESKTAFYLIGMALLLGLTIIAAIS